MGPIGLKEVATLSMQKAHFAAEQTEALPRLSLAFDQPFFKEFVVRDRLNEVPDLLKSAEQEGILAGIPLGQWYPDLEDCFLIAVTEQRTREEIDQLVGVLAKSETETLSHA